MTIIKERTIYEKPHDFRVVAYLYDNGSIRIQNEIYDDGTFMPEPGWYPTEDVFIPVDKMGTFYGVISEFYQFVFGSIDIDR